MDKQIEEYTHEQLDFIGRMRDAGYAVMVFSPQELRGADPEWVEECMISRGWDVIEATATKPCDEDE